MLRAVQDVSAQGRWGCAAALRALAPVLGDAEVTSSLDFLIGKGLADLSDRVRSAWLLDDTARFLHDESLLYLHPNMHRSC